MSDMPPGFLNRFCFACNEPQSSVSDDVNQNDVGRVHEVGHVQHVDPVQQVEEVDRPPDHVALADDVEQQAGHLQQAYQVPMAYQMNQQAYHQLHQAYQLQQLPQAHSQIDYIHHLVPDLLDIINCSFYWGKMDRYEAEKLLENRPEGTFLLRDSAQEEHLFSVSFRRFDRSLHARIEHSNHRFSFDSHDPCIFSSSTVCGLIEHYKDPRHCMFFEPMLTTPLHRNFALSLQDICRATICSKTTYDNIMHLEIPKQLKSFLKCYHYKQQVRVRRLDVDS